MLIHVKPLAQCQTQKKSWLNVSCYSGTREKSDATRNRAEAGHCTCIQQQGEVWCSWHWKTGYCGQELILTSINHLPPKSFSYASFPEETDRTASDWGQRFPKNLEDESARWAGSLHFIWVEADRGAYLWFRTDCLNQTQDLVSAYPSSVVAHVFVTPPCPLGRWPHWPLPPPAHHSLSCLRPLGLALSAA